MNTQDSSAQSYWRSSLRLIIGCLLVWFTVSLGFGIVFADLLNNIEIAGFPLGFWFAQQGAIYTFVILIFFYARRMNRIDRKHGVHEE